MSKFTAPLTNTNENDQERYFRWYCEELIQHGFLKSIEREPESYLVLPKMEYRREKHYKQKANEIEEFTLFTDTTYTYDYRLIWAEKALNIFTEIMDPQGYFVFGMPTFVSHYLELNGQTEIVSLVDVKPHYQAVAYGGGKMKSYYTFPFIQKFLYLTKRLYVNKAIPIPAGKHGISTCLFASTFTPNRYKFTDKSGSLRKIHFKTVSLKAFSDQRQRIIDSMLKTKNAKTNQTTLL